MTADEGAVADPLPPLSDPCSATTAEAAVQSGQVTRRSSIITTSDAKREPATPPATILVECEPLDAMTKARPGASQDGTRLTPSRPAIRVGFEVVRGEKLGKFLPILDGRNVIGRAVTEPVDIDLTGQEPVERVWVSRKHAILTFDIRGLVLEDLNSLNGTFVNRVRLLAGVQRVLQMGDVIQFGTVQVRVVEPPK